MPEFGRVGEVFMLSRYEPSGLIELLERRVVEADVVEILGRDPAFFHAGCCVAWEGLVMTDAGDAPFLRGGDDLAVLDQRHRGVVIEARDADDGSGLAHAHALRS
jgi:hypothetical protein